MASCRSQNAGDSISNISGATLEKAISELNENPTTRLESILELRRQILDAESKEIELTFTRKDSKFLLCFLRARKFDIVRALQLYVNYHKYRTKYSHLLSNYNPKSVDYLLESNTVGLLDQPLNDGSKCLLFFAGRYDIHNIPATEMFKAGLMVMDKLVEDEETQVHGLSLIEDLEGVSFHHVMTLINTDVMKKAIFIELIQNAFPARFKSCHMTRQPWYFSFVYALIKPLLRQKFRDRIHLHGWNVEHLHEYIDPALLPQELGGDQPPMPNGTLTKLFPGAF